MTTFLTMSKLSKALAPYYGNVPVGSRVLHRAIKNGMPTIYDPLYGHPRFVLEEVVAWIKSNREISNRIEIEARVKARRQREALK